MVPRDVFLKKEKNEGSIWWTILQVSIHTENSEEKKKIVKLCLETPLLC